MTPPQKLTLVDYGAGNLPSVERALLRLGAATERVTTPEPLARATAIILPGVGHFAALIRALDEHELRQPLCEAIQRGVPFLGICLGLQALFEFSEEAPDLAGLKLLPGTVRALPKTAKLPHMGWNQLRAARPARLLRSIPADAYFYFAHSYASVDPCAATAATCSHGAEFTAIVEKDNFFGVQFHPEKSGVTGARVLQNFLELASQ